MKYRGDAVDDDQWLLRDFLTENQHYLKNADFRPKNSKLEVTTFVAKPEIMVV